MMEKIQSASKPNQPIQFFKNVFARSGNGRIANQPPQPKLSYAMPDDPLLKSVLIRAVERLGGVGKLEKMYGRLLQQPEAEKNFWQAALQVLEVNLAYDEAQLAKIPSSGPVIFVANHPFGVLDGLAICHLATISRGDFRILLHAALCREERIEANLLPIDFDASEEATRTNIETKNNALQLLRDGGTIVIFPGGGISTSDGLLGPVTDLEWKLFVTKLIQMTEATVIPIYFHGRNSRIFQVVSQFSETLRLSMIVHEVRKKIGTTLQISIGDPIPYAEMASFKKRRELIQYLRTSIYRLGGCPENALRVGRVSERF